MPDSLDAAKELLELPLDVFGGADGGVGFAILRENLANCIESANNGNKTAQMLLEVFQRYDRMLRYFSTGGIKF